MRRGGLKLKPRGQICESADVVGARPAVVSQQHVLPESGSFFTQQVGMRGVGGGVLADLWSSVWIWTHST